MKIIKKKINGIDISVYKTKKYSTIHMKLLFELPYTRENIFKLDLLQEYMLFGNNKYKTREEIGLRRMELYSLDYSLSNFFRGEKLFSEVNFGFYDPELVRDDYMKEALEFVGDLLFNVNFEDGKLDKDALNKAKSMLISAMGDDLASARGAEKRSFIKQLYPDTYKTRDLIESKSEYEELLNSFTDRDIIEMYETSIHHSLVGIVIMGNIKDEYYDYIGEYLKFKETTILDKNFKEKLKISEKTPYYKEVKDPTTRDSVLKVVLEAPSRNFKEKMVYRTIARMLGGTGLLIYKILRDEKGIVYSAGVSYKSRMGYFLLYANLDAKNKDKALEGFEEAIGRLKNKKTIEELLKKIKLENEEALYVYDESKWNLYGELVDKTFKLAVPDKRRYKMMEKVTADECLEALEKLKIVKVHFYEGVRE